MPIDPSFALTGPEWTIEPVAPATGAGGAAGTAAGADGGFGDALGRALTSLQGTQEEAAQGAQALAAGTVSDPTAVVMSVERARLAMQLASQIRTKAVEAAQDLFHTQV
jgi:flagellar hook-basal body complex protein FliE